MVLVVHSQTYSLRPVATTQAPSPVSKNKNINKTTEKGQKKGRLFEQDNDILDWVLNHEDLKQSAVEFGKNEIRKVDSGMGKIVYVHQRERATALPSRVDFLGSADATTCTLLFLRWVLLVFSAA